jgi:hypothetical protein
MEPESENRDLVHVEASSTPKTETDADVAPLIRKVGLHRLRKSKS